MWSPELLGQLLQTAGVGGVLASLMFYFYRKDAKTWLHRHEEMMELMTKRHDDLLTVQHAQLSELLQVVKDNTVAMTKVASRLDNVVGVALDNGKR